ncbi:ribokinase-like [Phymastichus coffea]|uniref:ribokinase-like n=1 Tax=Phymastichus coffea TaxID=108790 RepID=UPI00273B55B9|nr:ribokinase-like [Phymastichus coffea]
MSKIIVVVGSCVVDFATYSSRLPKPGETLVGDRFERSFGGKGANQCVTAARLGASTALIGSLGSDSLGQEYLENLKRENIDLTHVKIKSNSDTGIAQIMVTETGENVIVTIFGANALMTCQDVLDAKDKIKSASVLVCQFETTLKATLEALKLFKGQGVSIVNGAPAMQNVHPDIFKLSDIFCVNETEAEIMTGIPNLQLSAGQLAIDKLLSFGCNTVIITFGSHGVIYASKNKKKAVHVPTMPVQAVDTTGAGDSFLGALAYFLAYNPDFPLEECIKRSNKIAAISVTKSGTQASFPYREDLQKELFQ